jgi:sugar phosphate isomerase/epimerase
MPFARSQISLQLYSLRAMRDAARMFAAAADAGYQAVELLATHLVAPAVTKRQLAARALVAPSAHVGLRLLRSRITQVLEACDEIGVAELIVSSVPRWRRYGGDHYWRRVGVELVDLATKIEESTCVRLGYHNHGWEFRSLPRGGTPIERVFAADMVHVLRWQLDLNWLLRAGQDPYRWLEFGRGRISSVHVGEPNADFASLLQGFERIGVNRLVVELDNPGQPEAMCRHSLEAILAFSPPAAAAK